ncbi:MAG TPA: FtsW/RodA/SpoVE family cell cycle protein [Pirellulales bacterium]
MYDLLITRRKPWGLLASAALLLLLSWLAIARSEQLVDGSGRLLRQQIVWSVLGVFALFGIARVNYRVLGRNSAIGLAIVILALAAVYALPTVNGAHRWIRLGGIGIQPSEFAKLIFIVALAQYLSRPDATVSFITAVAAPIAICAVLMLLVLKEPDLGTSLTFLPVMFAMLWGAGVRRRDLIRMSVAGVMLLPLLWSQMSHEQRSRVTALWEQNGPHEAATADGFHLDQAKRMLSVGSVWGSFFGDEPTIAQPAFDRPSESIDSPALPCSIESEEFDSSQIIAVPIAARLRLPEPHTDSIFCIVGERFGLAGVGAMLSLYFLLIGSCIRTAAQTEEPVGRSIAVGVAALFAAEVLINAGMLVGLLPITGLSLPLISYGGSDLLVHLMALGLVISVARCQPSQIL